MSDCNRSPTVRGASLIAGRARPAIVRLTAGMGNESRRLRVAFLGLGRMGTPMARHVLTAGHDLTVWNRTGGRADALAADGATVAPTPAAAACDRDVVVLMLADPDAVEQVLLGPDGVASGADPDTLVVDGSTIGPDASRRMATRLREHRLRYVDAPVYGSVGPATEGTLGVLVGGEETDVAAARPLLEPLGRPGEGAARRAGRRRQRGQAGPQPHPRPRPRRDRRRVAAGRDPRPPARRGGRADRRRPARRGLPAGTPDPGVRAAGDRRLHRRHAHQGPAALSGRRAPAAAGGRGPRGGEAAHAAGHGQDDSRALPLRMRDAS